MYDVIRFYTPTVLRIAPMTSRMRGNAMTSEVPEEVQKANELLLSRAHSLAVQSRSAITTNLEIHKQPSRARKDAFDHVSGTLNTMYRIPHFAKANNLDEAMAVLKTGIDKLVDEVALQLKITEPE